MIYLKKTAEVALNKLLSMTNLFQLQKFLLVNLVVLSSVKDYLYQSVSEEKFFILPDNVKKIAQKNKKILVLDMDETLVYTRRETKPNHRNYRTINYGGKDMFIELRPMLAEFLEAVSMIFEVYIYTAGDRSYADAVIDEIDKKKIIQKRFYRDSCKKQNGSLYKDLRHLKKTNKLLTEMILIDDNSLSIGHNYPFSIKIKQFEGDQSDKELITIFKNLLKFYS